MTRTALSIRYLLLTYRLDHLWLASGFLGLTAILVVLLEDHQSVNYLVRGFLGMALPLIGGVLAAYAVLDDPALELQYATPRPAWRTLAERLGLILAIIVAMAILFQGILAVMGMDLSYLGSLWSRQLAWLVPSLALVAFGSAMSFAGARTATGAMMIGGLWIMQVIMRGWLLRDPLARYLFVFAGAVAPDHPEILRGNYICMSLLTLVFLATAWSLFKRQERYL